jgi:hypothetical protein
VLEPLAEDAEEDEQDGAGERAEDGGPHSLTENSMPSRRKSVTDEKPWAGFLT